MREVQEKEKEEKLSKYTYIPKICKNNKKILNDSIISNNDSVYDNLYKRRNDKNKAIEKVKKKIKEEKNNGMIDLYMIKYLYMIPKMIKMF